MLSVSKQSNAIFFFIFIYFLFFLFYFIYFFFLLLLLLRYAPVNSCSSGSDVASILWTSIRDVTSEMCYIEDICFF